MFPGWNNKPPIGHPPLPRPRSLSPMPKPTSPSDK